jgi:hypothetical protein
VCMRGPFRVHIEGMRGIPSRTLVTNEVKKLLWSNIGLSRCEVDIGPITARVAPPDKCSVPGEEAYKNV